MNEWVSRRRLLAGLGAAGTLACLGAMGLRSRSGAGVRSTVCTVVRKARALGAQITITTAHGRREVASRAIDEALRELATVERVMSLYRPDSDISILNRQEHLDQPHPCLVEVLEAARGVAQASSGAFDVTVGPLWDLYARAWASATLPAEGLVQQARAKVNWRQVQLFPGRIALGEPGMAITLNGIAQGYAADRALAAIRRCGVQHALIDTGEIGSLGRSGTGGPWQAAVQHPRIADAVLTTIQLDGRCVSTSGDYATTFSDDFLHHHIFDPSTGHSPRELASVTVVAPSACLADALSTALLVMGLRRGLDLLKQYPGTDALLVTKDQRVHSTDGFPIA